MGGDGFLNKFVKSQQKMDEKSARFFRGGTYPRDLI
jgi:hypothetical protein